jgi:UDP-galactopyranose mutase
VTDDLLVCSPPATIPGNLHFRTLNALVHTFAWYHLRRVVPGIEGRGVDVLVSWPPAFELARSLRPRRLIYDCLDLFPSFDEGRRQRLLTSLENDLAGAAFAVVVTSRALERRWSSRHPRVVRIPNGVDLTVFAAPGAVPAIPADIAALPRPRLGYIGTVGRWVDVPLLQYVARRRPGCSIAVVGPVEPRVARPSGPPNLVLLGERPYASLPAYLAGMDALRIAARRALALSSGWETRVTAVSSLLDESG